MSEIAAFLRGINVGSIRIKMPDLKACFESLGLHNVRTYQQTGNVLFESNRPFAELKLAIEAALTERFHYEAYVLLREARSLAKAVADYPFVRNDGHHAYLLFVDHPAVLEDLAAQGLALGEPVARGEGLLYWRVVKGETLGTPFSKVLGKVKYKAVTTNRNANTLELMLVAVSNLPPSDR